MDNQEQSASDGAENKTLLTLSVGALVVFLLLVGGIYYWVSKKNGGQVVFPAGINYLAPQTSNPSAQNAPAYDYAKMAASADWLTFKGKTYNFSFQYPKGLNPLTFPNDSADTVTFKTSNAPPELNLMFLVETISSRDKTLIGKQEEFVRNYWKFFSGLKGLNSITAFTNEKGLSGFKVNYVSKSGALTSDNYFFIIPGDADHMFHAADIFPAEGKTIFDRIINSLAYKIQTVTPTP